MQNARMKKWDLWFCYSILRFRDEKGTSICLYFSFFLFVSLTVEPNEPLSLFFFFLNFEDKKLSFTKTPQWKRWFLLYSIPSFEILLLWFLSLQPVSRERESGSGGSVVQDRTTKVKTKNVIVTFVIWKNVN